MIFLALWWRRSARARRFRRKMLLMKVLSAEEMRACDRLSCELTGEESFELMRRAARAVADVALVEFPEAKRILILAGRGNNGGDGLVAAPLLAAKGRAVTVLLAGNPSELKGDAARAWAELDHNYDANLHLVPIESVEEIPHPAELLASDLIVDALLGTGFQPPLRGLVADLVRWMLGSRAPRLAVDLPSGWPSDSVEALPQEIDELGEISAKDLQADVVVSFTAPRPAHLFGQITRNWHSPILIAPIGSPEAAIRSKLKLYWAGESMKVLAEPRRSDSNKGNFGHILVVGGAWGSAGAKAGAPSMAALAAMRSGAGLVTAAVPDPALAAVLGHAPELMGWPLSATNRGEIAASNADPEALQKLLQGKSVLVVGPGIGQSEESARYLHALLAASRIPAVVDADALNILASHPEWITELGRNRSLILTPHPGEMARLTGLSVAEVQARRLEVARDFACSYNVTLILKGARTVIAHPTGRVAVNTTGNPGMAKGGSGDLLAGMIAALLAQHPQRPEMAAEAAVTLHGLAADLALADFAEQTLLATDSLMYLSSAFRFGFQGPSGYLWLQGLAAHQATTGQPHARQH